MENEIHVETVRGKEPQGSKFMNDKPILVQNLPAETMGIRENVSDRAGTFARAWWAVEEGRPESLRTCYRGWSCRGGWGLTWMSGQ